MNGFVAFAYRAFPLFFRLVAPHRHRELPWPREYFLILDRRDVVDPIRARKGPSLLHSHGVAVEASDDVEPRSVIVVGHVDDEGVAFPPSARISHPQFERVADWRAPVEIDDAIVMTEFVQNHDVLRKLKYPHVPLVVDPGHALLEASRNRVQVLDFGRPRMLRVMERGLLRRPGQVRDLAIGWVDHRLALLRGLAADSRVLFAIGEARLDAVRRDIASLAPVTLDVRLAVRGPRRIPSWRDRGRRLLRARRLTRDGTCRNQRCRD